MKLLIFCSPAISQSHLTGRQSASGGENHCEAVHHLENKTVHDNNDDINTSFIHLIFSDSSPAQSWHASFSSAWMTLIRSVWRIPTRCWSRALPCSTCGPPARAREPKVSVWHMRQLWIFLIPLMAIFMLLPISLTKSNQIVVVTVLLFVLGISLLCLLLHVCHTSSLQWRACMQLWRVSIVWTSSKCWRASRLSQRDKAPVISADADTMKESTSPLVWPTVSLGYRITQCSCFLTSILPWSCETFPINLSQFSLKFPEIVVKFVALWIPCADSMSFFITLCDVSKLLKILSSAGLLPKQHAEGLRTLLLYYSLCS